MGVREKRKLKLDIVKKVEDVQNVSQNSHFESISEILIRCDTQLSHHVLPTGNVVTIRSSDYCSFTRFREAYLALRFPALCVVDESEVPKVIQWLRKGDDVATRDDPPELNRWRIDRIIQSHAGQLDPQTGVFQRNRLIESLQEVCPQASSTCPVSLILMDIDHLKGNQRRVWSCWRRPRS